MKKFYFLLFALLLMNFTTLNAQKCKVGKDPITNESVVTFDYGSRAVYFEYKGSTIHLEMRFNYNGVYKVIVPKGTELIFKLENGEIIKLPTITDTPPKTDAATSSSSMYIYTNYCYQMELTKEQVTKLADSKVILLRYPDGQGGTLDYTPKGLGKILTNAINKGANCIKENF